MGFLNIEMMHIFMRQHTARWLLAIRGHQILLQHSKIHLSFLYERSVWIRHSVLLHLTSNLVSNLTGNMTGKLPSTAKQDFHTQQLLASDAGPLPKLNFPDILCEKVFEPVQNLIESIGSHSLFQQILRAVPNEIEEGLTIALDDANWHNSMLQASPRSDFPETNSQISPSKVNEFFDGLYAAVSSLQTSSVGALPLTVGDLSRQEFPIHNPHLLAADISPKKPGFMCFDDRKSTTFQVAREFRRGRIRKNFTSEQSRILLESYNKCQYLTENVRQFLMATCKMSKTQVCFVFFSLRNSSLIFDCR